MQDSLFHSLIDIRDSGNFKWADDPDKWPEFCGPSPSYHGAVLEEALRPLGNLVYLVHIRVLIFSSKSTK